MRSGWRSIGQWWGSFTLIGGMHKPASIFVQEVLAVGPIPAELFAHADPFRLLLNVAPVVRLALSGRLAVRMAPRGRLAVRKASRGRLAVRTASCGRLAVATSPPLRRAPAAALVSPSVACGLVRVFAGLVFFP